MAVEKGKNGALVEVEEGVVAAAKEMARITLEISLDGKGAVVEVEKGVKGGVVEVDEGAAEGAKKVAGRDMITLKSSDGETFEILKEAAERLSKFLKEKISGDSNDGAIELENISSDTLEKVVEYFNKHADSNPSAISVVDTAASEDLEEWDRKLVDDLSMGTFFDLVNVADYLGMDGLLYVTCHKLADMIRGRSPVELREMFNIKNDYTPEEEKEVRREHAWAFEDYED